MSIYQLLMEKFNDKAFRAKLKQLVRKHAESKVGRFASMVRKIDPTVTHGSMSAYLDDRMPGIDKAWAIARTGGLTLDELVGGLPLDMTRYKKALWILFRKTIDSQIVDFSDFDDEAILDKFVDSVLNSEKKQGKK